MFYLNGIHVAIMKLDWLLTSVFCYGSVKIMRVRNCAEINLSIERRTNFHRLGGGGSHSGAMATDDNNAYGNLGKLYDGFIS